MKINDDLFDKKVKEELNLKHSVVPDNINDIFDETTNKLLCSRRVKSKRITRIAVACIVVIVITGGIFSTPAIAEKIPFVGEIYKKLGLFKDMEEYTNSIGETKEVNGYNFTIDNIIGTADSILVSVKVVSPVPFKKAAKLDNLSISVDLSDMQELGIKSFGSSTRAFYIDDYTAIIIGEIKNDEGKFKSIGDLNLTVAKSDEVSSTFNVKYNFKSSFDKVERIKINKKINNTTIDNLISSVIKTDLAFRGDFNECVGRGSDKCYIEIDGKINRSVGGSGTDNGYKIHFPTIKYDDVKNAESINVICVESSDDINDVELFRNVEWVSESGVKYPKTITSKSGLKGSFYKVDKVDGVLKLYFESEYNPINLLSQLILSQNINGEKYGDNIFGTAYQNGDKENSYIFEFKDIDFEKNIEIFFGGANTTLDKIKEVNKIKIK
ncbi:MAG: DUF4179 domain-containing protein [Clostridium sp.]